LSEENVFLINVGSIKQCVEPESTRADAGILAEEDEEKCRRETGICKELGSAKAAALSLGWLTARVIAALRQ